MLFHQNTKKALRIGMFILGILVIISMVMMYVPKANTIPTPAPTVSSTPNIQINTTNTSTTTFSI